MTDENVSENTLPVDDEDVPAVPAEDPEPQSGFSVPPYDLVFQRYFVNIDAAISGVQGESNKTDRQQYKLKAADIALTLVLQAIYANERTPNGD